MFVWLRKMDKSAVQSFRIAMAARIMSPFIPHLIVCAGTLLRFLNRLGGKTFFDTPVRNQPDQCSQHKDRLSDPGCT